MTWIEGKSYSPGELVRLGDVLYKRGDDHVFRPHVEVQVLPYMGPPPETEREKKRKRGKSPEAIGTGIKKTWNGINEYE